MVAVTILQSKHTILYVLQLVVTIQSVARKWTANATTAFQRFDIVIIALAAITTLAVQT